MAGGGAGNGPLRRFTANACSVPVVDGPPESTAVGNLLVLAKAAGPVSSLSEPRGLVSVSRILETFEPENAFVLDDASARYPDIRRESGNPARTLVWALEVPGCLSGAFHGRIKVQVALDGGRYG